MLGLLGVPTSAGAFAPGQEQAPAALRAAGLLEVLRAAGAEVCDHGDREVWRWRPDREHPRAQNAATVVEIVRDTARRVAASIAAGETTLVLGGDCTVGIGTVAGHVGTGERVGLFYFDAHADLNVPASVLEGALDWMGWRTCSARGGRAGAGPRRAAARGRAGRAVRVGPRAGDAVRARGARTAWALGRPRRRGRRRPEAAGLRFEVWSLRCDALAHCDVDVIDFTDAPLSENTGRNEGLAYAPAMQALPRLLASPKLAGLTVTELNPDHAEPGSLERFARALGESLAQRPSKRDR